MVVFADDTRCREAPFYDTFRRSSLAQAIFEAASQMARLLQAA